MKVAEITGILQEIAQELANELEMTVEIKSSIVTQPDSNAPGEFKGKIKEKTFPGGTLCRFRAAIGQDGDIMLMEFTDTVSAHSEVELDVILKHHFGKNFSINRRLL